MPQPHELAASLAAPRSVGRILKESFQRYFRQFGPFTRPLVLPVLYKLVGGILAVLGPFLFVDLFMTSLDTEEYRHLGLWYFQQSFPVRTLLMALVVVPGIFLFTRGFWLYLVYMASLNINAVEALAGQTPDFRAAYAHIRPLPYTRLLLLLLSIWLPSLMLYLLTFALPGIIPVPAGALLIMGICLLGSILAALAAVLLSVYLSVSFQVFALEGQDRAPSVLKRSILLVWRNFWRTLLLLLVMGIVTTVALPFLVNLVLDLTRLSDVLVIPARYFVDQLLAYLAPGELGALFNTGGAYAILYPVLVAESAALARDLLHSIIATVITLLVLPLGTFASTLLYLDLRTQKPVS